MNWWLIIDLCIELNTRDLVTFQPGTIGLMSRTPKTTDVITPNLRSSSIREVVHTSTVTKWSIFIKLLATACAIIVSSIREISKFFPTFFKFLTYSYLNYSGITGREESQSTLTHLNAILLNRLKAVSSLILWSWTVRTITIGPRLSVSTSTNHTHTCIKDSCSHLFISDQLKSLVQSMVAEPDQSKTERK